MFFRKRKKISSSPIDFLVVGLGNPGRKYEGTRHNVGFMVMEKLEEDLKVKINRVKFKSYCADATISEARVLLMMPQTFMNLSGEAVVEAMNFYKLKPEQVLVIYDDISLDVGVMRIRRNGSDGGQKGIRSIISLNGSDNFPRIKIGVGEKPHPDYDMSAWVLSKFTDSEKNHVYKAIADATRAIDLIVADKMEEAMSLYSR